MEQVYMSLQQGMPSEYDVTMIVSGSLRHLLEWYYFTGLCVCIDRTNLQRLRHVSFLTCDGHKWRFLLHVIRYLGEGMQFVQWYIVQHLD